VTFLRTLQDRQGLVLSLPTLAQLALGQGDVGRAGQLLAEGLHLAEQADDRLALARGMESVAALVGGQDPGGALRLAGAAAALRESLGAQLTPADRARLEQWQVRALRDLGTTAYSTALAEGRQRALEEAVAVAASTAAAASASARARDPEAALTRREQEVAALLARGLTNRNIAQALVISEGTVRTHVQRVLDKLGLKSRVQLAGSLELRGLLPHLTP
jgi:non-specific serine/threonine protein kinase